MYCFSPFYALCSAELRILDFCECAVAEGDERVTGQDDFPVFTGKRSWSAAL